MPEVGDVIKHDPGTGVEVPFIVVSKNENDGTLSGTLLTLDGIQTGVHIVPDSAGENTPPATDAPASNTAPGPVVPPQTTDPAPVPDTPRSDTFAHFADEDSENRNTDVGKLSKAERDNLRSSLAAYDTQDGEPSPPVADSPAPDTTNSEVTQ